MKLLSLINRIIYDINIFSKKCPNFLYEILTWENEKKFLKKNSII